MFNRILVPLDGSELAEGIIPWIGVLSAGLKCRVELVTVVPRPPSVWDSVEPGKRLTSSAASYTPRLRDSLDRVQTFLIDRAPEISTITYEGDPGYSIAIEADGYPGTLIAMTTHGRAGLPRSVLGSVAGEVLRSCASPMLLFRPSGREALPADLLLKTVIVPLDGSLLAERILYHVNPLAKALDLNVKLVRVVPSLANYLAKLAAKSKDHEIAEPVLPYAEFREQEEFCAAEYLHKTRCHLQDQGVSKVEELVLHGDVARTIEGVARETQANLVAITTHARTGRERWALGSVADHLVRRSGDPILITRASEEFVALSTTPWGRWV